MARISHTKLDSGHQPSELWRAVVFVSDAIDTLDLDHASDFNGDINVAAVFHLVLTSGRSFRILDIGLHCFSIAVQFFVDRNYLEIRFTDDWHGQMLAILTSVSITKTDGVFAKLLVKFDYDFNLEHLLISFGVSLPLDY